MMWPFEVALGHPQRPVSRWEPISADADHVQAAWASAVLDTARWEDRCRIILDAYAQVAERERELAPPGAPFDEVYAASTAALLTAAIEHLGETKIRDMEAAAIYALTLHDEWFLPALSWLTRHGGAEFQHWVDERPTYRRFAADLRLTQRRLPAWLAGGEA